MKSLYVLWGCIRAGPGAQEVECSPGFPCGSSRLHNKHFIVPVEENMLATTAGSQHPRLSWCRASLVLIPNPEHISLYHDEGLTFRVSIFPTWHPVCFSQWMATVSIPCSWDVIALSLWWLGQGVTRLLQRKP